MSKKVVGPDVIDERISFISGKNFWYYIDIINNQLKTNVVNNDNTIEVTINYKIDTNIVDQIVDMYIREGWEQIDVSNPTTNQTSIYGTTLFVFHAPSSVFNKAKNILS